MFLSLPLFESACFKEHRCCCCSYCCFFLRPVPGVLVSFMLWFILLKFAPASALSLFISMETSCQSICHALLGHPLDKLGLKLHFAKALPRYQRATPLSPIFASNKGESLVCGLRECFNWLIQSWKGEGVQRAFAALTLRAKSRAGANLRKSLRAIRRTVLKHPLEFCILIPC